MAKKIKTGKGVGVTYKYPRAVSLLAVLLPKSTTAGCFTSRLSEIVTGLMYVLVSRANILLQDCSHMAQTELLKMHAEQPDSSLRKNIEIGHTQVLVVSCSNTPTRWKTVPKK